MDKVLSGNLIPSLKSKVKEEISQTASGLVPNTRTVNGKALSQNITLSASDVSAVPSSSFILTSAQQTKVQNLPASVSTALASATSTSTQAKIALTNTTLANGTSASTAYNLPMASTSLAGCITATDKTLINSISNKQPKIYTDSGWINSTPIDASYVDLPVTFTVPDSSAHLLVIGLELSSTSGNLTNVSISMAFSKTDGSVAGIGARNIIVPNIMQGSANYSTSVHLIKFPSYLIGVEIRPQITSNSNNVTITGYQSVMLI